MKAKLLTIVFGLLCVTSFAQGKFGATPEDSAKCVEKLSLYIEFFKQKNYADAVGPWREAIQICPKSRKSLYINGVKMMKHFIKEETDDAKKQELIKELFQVYHTRIEHFGEEGFVKGRLGSDMLKYDKVNLQAAHDMLKESFELQGNKSEPGAVVYYFRSMYSLVRKKKEPVEKLIALYGPVMEVVTFNLNEYKDHEKKTKAWNQVKDNVNDMFSKVATCEDLLPIFKENYESVKDNADELKQMLNLMDKRDCTEDPFYLKVAIRLNELEPSAVSSYSIGSAQSKLDNCKEAVNLFKLAFELAEDDEMKAKAAMASAKCYFNLGQYSAVRTWCQKALGVNPKLGEAHILIGDSYSASAKIDACKGDNDCTKKAVYWVAVDRYQKAKSVDPSVAEQANKRIANASGQFPKQEDCFFVSIAEGSSYTVGCWINETTTVRFLKP